MGQDAPEILHEGLSNFAPMLQPVSSSSTIIEPPQETKSQVKKKSKHKRKARGSKPNKWADKCMYAELLEMNEDEVWSTTGDGLDSDGLPNDLEIGWVAVAPVPVGKRCLAVTHQSAGLAGAGACFKVQLSSYRFQSHQRNSAQHYYTISCLG